VLGHSFENETPYTQQWHLGIERALFNNYMVEVGYLGSKGTHLIFGYNPNEVQPGLGSQASRRPVPEELGDVPIIALTPFMQVQRRLAAATGPGPSRSIPTEPLPAW